MSVFTDFPLIPRSHKLWPEDVKAYQYDDIDIWMPLNGPFSCGLCGEYVGIDFIDGKAIAKTTCLAPNGITTTTVIDVPSGKIIVGDSLRPVFGPLQDDEESFVSYNSKLGKAQVVEFYATQGCAYGPVGNTCPSLYRTGPDTYVIASPDYTRTCHKTDQCDEDYCDCTDEVIIPEEWTELAGVCTDLWAYSIADYDLWLRRGGKPVEEMGWTYTVVEVPRGRYEFTLHTGERDFDSDAKGDIIFADIKYLGADYTG